jgi:hypothetical protein
VDILRFFAKQGPADTEPSQGFKKEHRNVSLEREPPRSATAAAAVSINWCVAADTRTEDSLDHQFEFLSAM